MSFLPRKEAPVKGRQGEAFMFHVTTRLLLRPFWSDDWQQVFDGIADEGVVRNLARVPWPYAEDDARSWTRRSQDCCFPSFAVIESASGRLIGSAGIAGDDDKTELGYWIRRDAWGHGYATEAARGVIEIARMLGHRRLVAGHFIDNPASGAVLRKAGFVATGQRRRRFSLARGTVVETIEHALDLDSDAMPYQQAA